MNPITLSPAPVHPLMPKDKVAEVWIGLQSIKSRIREYEQDVKNGLMEWLKENGGKLFIGDKMLVVGPKKMTKCRNVRALLELLITRYAVEDLAGLLASDAFKHGGAKKVLTPEEWDQNFEVTVGEEVEVKEIDTRYLP